MTHTKNQIETLVKKLLSDIDRHYRENESIYIEFENDCKIPTIEERKQNVWVIGVPVEDDQWHKEEGSNILIFIDDASLTVIRYLDSSMGRPVPMIAKKDNEGKFSLIVQA